MSKSVYVYLNTDDLIDLINELVQRGTLLFDIEKQQIRELPFAVDSIREMYLYNKENGYVVFSPCFYLGNQLQCGSFCLMEDKCANSLKLFSQIKKVIRHKYVYSKENALYYGTGFYSDWINRRISLPFPLCFDRIEIMADKIGILFTKLQNTCFSVRPNNVRFRDIHNIDLLDSSFIIYYNEKSLKKTIIRKAFVRYEYDSACIFVDKDERNGNYSVMFDRRLANECSELRLLFEELSFLCNDL